MLSFSRLFSAIVLLCLLSPTVYSNPFESLVMPGEVIKGHKKYESDCSNCHKLFSKKGQDKLCLGCHKKVHKDIKKKKGFHGRNKAIRNVSCKSCHTEHKGRNADIIKLDSLTFDHNKTDFRLLGKHKVAECTSCHLKNKKYREAPSACKSCHKKESPHKKARADKKWFRTCSGCHNASDWGRIKFNHNKTKYRLTGAHKTALCDSCHINQRYKKTPKKCISCHKADDTHRGKNGSKCNKCHTTEKWGKIAFNHSKDTRFPLKGKHKKTPCRSCHKKVELKNRNGKKKKARTCYSCHVYDDTHKGRFGKKCSKCHSESKWDKAKFNHNKDTKFPLRGKHSKTDCNSCHIPGKKKLKRSCISCHKSDDIHKGSLGTKCNSCHSEKSWKKISRFEHDLTAFPLIGMHGAVACEECHSGSDHNNIKIECASCHKSTDNHKGKLGNSCNLCHTPNDWGVWFFEHNKQSKFKITGAHKKVHCHSCHFESVKKIPRTPRSCRNCHAAEDPHNGEFGTRCGKCHTTKNFEQVRIR